jgi:uncharacterized protein
VFRVPVQGRPISILELGGLPSEIVNVVVSVLARLAFDFGVWSAGRIPITFVCEEAHRYVPIDKTLGFEPTKRAISRIAKEGRKYGVSLCIVTQRPAELDPTILSQCSTIFSFRLTNEKDQEILRAGISDAAASLLEFMSTMGTGDAITFGEGVALPTRIKFDILPAHAMPKSNTASFTKNWARDMPDDTFLIEVVNRWRQQSYNPTNTDYGSETLTVASHTMQDALSRQAPPPAPPPRQPLYPQQPPAVESGQPPSLRIKRPFGTEQGTMPQGQPAQPQAQYVPPGQVPPAQPPQPAEGQPQPSLASLLKQFRA